MKRFNPSAYFILPLIKRGVTVMDIKIDNFINSYISEDRKSLILAVKTWDMLQPIQEYKDLWYEESENGDEILYVEFEIPEEFLPDVDLMFEGKYSKFSNKAKHRIKTNHHKIYLDEKPTKKLIDEILMKRLNSWPYPVEYIFTKGDLHLYSDILIALFPQENKYKKEYRKRKSKELGFDIPPQIDIYEKPDIKKEIKKKSKKV